MASMIEIAAECWSLALVAATVALVCVLVHRGMAARHASRERPETDEVREISQAILDERARLKRGFRRISDDPNPLEAFIDAISGQSDKRDHGERRR